MSLKVCTVILALVPFAASADAALIALAERSKVSQADLSVILADCDSTQRNMNLCSFYSMIVAEQQLDQLITENDIGTAQEHDTFKAQTRDTCTREAQDDAGGGSMIPLMITSCMAEVYTNLHDVILNLTGVMPDQPPGKWQ